MYCCVRKGKRGKHNIFFLGGAFRKAKYEIRQRKSEGGPKFLPLNPLPFCPPERSVWRAKRVVSFVQKRFGVRQIIAPFYLSKLVEAAGIEPASENLPTEHLHT